jgi:hypothetical protein
MQQLPEVVAETIDAISAELRRRPDELKQPKGELQAK